jgi:hypothetical protein
MFNQSGRMPMLVAALVVGLLAKVGVDAWALRVHAADAALEAPAAKARTQQRAAAASEARAKHEPVPVEAAASIEAAVRTSPDFGPEVRPGVLGAIQTLIASLPDPDEPAFADDFDFGVGAIERAVESRGYDLYRNALEARRELRWLLFRKERGEGARVDLLAVLLVPERPASGIDPAAMRAALTAAHALEVLSGAASQAAPLLVLGPSFSGSAGSLRRALEAFCVLRAAGGPPGCAGRSLHAVSGSATEPSVAEVIGQVAGFARVTYHATVNGTESLRLGMATFLAGLGIGAEEVAMLQEASTPFGHGGRISEDSSSSAGAIEVAFPLHVAELARAARAPDAASSRVAASSLQSPEAMAHVRLLLDNTLGALRRQGVTQVGILASSTADKMFLVEQLHEAVPDVRAHLIESSVAFARRDARRAMDGTLVVASYPLFAATQAAPPRESGQGAPGLRQVQLFPTDAAQGLYNAALILLADVEPELQQALPLALRDYRHPFDRRARPGPPVWVSVVIGGDLWPLAAYRFGERDAHVFRPRDDGPPARPAFRASAPALAGMVFLLVLILGNTFAAMRVTARRELGRRLRRCPFLLFYGPAPADTSQPGRLGRFALLLPTSADQRRTIQAGALALTAAACFLALVARLPEVIEGGLPSLFVAEASFRGVLTLWLFWCAVGFLLLVTVATIRARLADRASGNAALAFIVPLLIVGGLLGLGLGAVRWFAGGSDGRALLFFARVTDPSVGLTPTLPLLVVATTAYLSCLFRLRVLRRIDRLELLLAEVRPAGAGMRATSLSATVAAPGSTGPGPSGSNARLRSRALTATFAKTGRRSMIAAHIFGAVVALLVYLAPGLRIRTLEGPYFDFVLNLSFGMLFGSIVVAALRTQRLVGHFTRYLHELAVHPLAPAFERMPAHVSRAFRTPMPGRLPTVDVHDSCREAQRRIRLLDAGRPGAGGEASGVEASWRVLRRVWNGEPDVTAALEAHEDHVALRLAEIIGLACDATRTMLFIAAIAAVAAVLATATYPFQPAGTLGIASMLTVAFVVLVAARTIVAFERDEILSRIAKTKGGEITATWSLAARVFGYVVTPLATLLATHLPDHGRLSDLVRAAGKLLEQ